MQLILLIGPPDESLAFTASLIARNARFSPLPQGRLLTALAHAGIEANIDKAPYDHILAGPSQRLFLGRVKGGLDAWPAACRAYLDTLLEAAAEIDDAPCLLDTAPEYARLWPFIERVLSDSNPILLVRNPVATAAEILSTPGDSRRACHLLNSWRQLATLVRTRGDTVRVLRYEHLVRAPEAELRTLEPHFGGDWRTAVQDGPALDAAAEQEAAWPAQLAADSALLHRVRALLERVAPADLHALGFPWKAAWTPVETALGASIPPRPVRVKWHAATRALAERSRRIVHARPGLEARVRKLKLACDVLLRE